MNPQPRNTEEWQDAMAAVEVVQALSFAAAYGVIDSAGRIDLRRCYELEAAARAHGVPPIGPRPPIEINVYSVAREAPAE